MERVSQSFSERLWHSVRMMLHLGHTTFTGLVFAAIGGRQLVSDRWPNFRYRGFLQVVELFAYLWMAVVFWPLRQTEEPTGALAAFGLLGAALLGVFCYFPQHDWAVVGVGIVMSALMWFVGNCRARFFILAFAGWLLGGLLAVLTQWPGDQRLNLLFVIGGVATALQGVLEIPRLRKTLKTRQHSASTAPP